MRHRGLVTMTLFLCSLCSRFRLYTCRHLMADMNDGLTLKEENSTSGYDVIFNDTVADDILRQRNDTDTSDMLNISTSNLTYELTNVSAESNYSVNVVELQTTTRRTQQAPTSIFPPEPKKELPMAMIIAGPAAAVSIFLFLCIAYYFHNLQLNKKVKRLSITLYVTPEPSTENSNCDSTYSHTRTHKLVPAPSPSPIPFGGGNRNHSTRDSDLFCNNQRRKSIMPPPTLGVPNLGKRGSNWSAIADQEILTMSAPRRHSTFIL